MTGRITNSNRWRRRLQLNRMSRNSRRQKYWANYWHSYNHQYNQSKIRRFRKQKIMRSSFTFNNQQLLQKVPPIQQSMRYGNKAFRDWLDQINPIVDDYLKKQLPQNLQNAAVELRSYLLDSFGNKQRIDYGTGHEFQFFLFLFSLFRLGIYTEKDYEGIVRLAFYKYIDFARKVQMTYMLEPAGSHGVWGLDDYQFLPFVFGAAELIQNDDGLLPDSIIKENVIKNYKAEYMFFQCIDIHQQCEKRTIP
ncbi:unnamed protein product (macronuclear) [Paramecium tetraurelia]|uniref:Serine/threonine-protein phosphatase 2A activator n=1 Tax=Paramecium tetraurelia TaxID=5888 RepID=A0CRU1_PARTE|nr:uncharacterized protein GSPATT00009823001 [Paramecium tetraurelia]CAK73508.1 unnamed protein product [Paramecium tetraurelia]|eukprot:XP_001440905.1 hypothetical protein (macronuclear) [Paramecium tetraurelia strain d4-2]